MADRPLGHEAVRAFFVLSGLVIAFVTDTKETMAADYSLSRLSRMYSVMIPGLLLTLTLDTAGKPIEPGLYIFPDKGWISFVESMLFANQIGNIDTYPGLNVPFWSLG